MVKSPQLDRSETDVIGMMISLGLVFPITERDNYNSDGYLIRATRRIFPGCAIRPAMEH